LTTASEPFPSNSLACSDCIHSKYRRGCERDRRAFRPERSVNPPRAVCVPAVLHSGGAMALADTPGALATTRLPSSSGHYLGGGSKSG
jgi:hypothetical protein